jgi:hypothetical protein
VGLGRRRLRRRWVLGDDPLVRWWRAKKQRKMQEMKEEEGCVRVRERETEMRERERERETEMKERERGREKETNKKRWRLEQCNASCGVTLFINGCHMHFGFFLHNPMEQAFYHLLSHSSIFARMAKPMGVL